MARGTKEALDESNPALDKNIALRTPKQSAWVRFKSNKVGIISAAVATFFIMLAIFAPLIIKLWGLEEGKLYGENLDETGMPIGKFGGMSLAHPLGIEPGAGRDVFTLLLYGSRISFTVAAITSVTSIGIGLIIGIASGYFKGKFDFLVGRFSDFILAFPATFMIVALSIPMVQRVESLGIAKENGARVVVLIAFFVFFGWAGFARLIRSQALSMRERDFLSAEAVFSFLGVGIQAPASTWGLVLADSITYWRADPAYLLIPCIMLIVIVLSLNLLGDAIRDSIDPKSER